MQIQFLYLRWLMLIEFFLYIFSGIFKPLHCFWRTSRITFKFTFKFGYPYILQFYYQYQNLLKTYHLLFLLFHISHRQLIKIDISAVPPPTSTINILISRDELFFSIPYANPALVGSFIILRTSSKPAILPAVFVAFR